MRYCRDCPSGTNRSAIVIHPTLLTEWINRRDGIVIEHRFWAEDFFGAKDFVTGVPIPPGQNVK